MDEILQQYEVKSLKAKFMNYIVIFLLIVIMTGCGDVQDGEVFTNPEAVGFTVPSAILETKESIEDDVLYYIQNENIESGFMQNLISFHGNFLLYGFFGEMTEDSPENTRFHIQLISPNTGEAVASKSFSGMEMPNVQECGDTLVINDWGKGKIVLLDENLSEIDTYQVTCEYNSMYVSTDAKKVYVFTPDQGLQITNLSTGKMTVELEDTVNLFVANDCGNIITFSFIDRRTQLEKFGVLDLENGDIMDFPYEGPIYDIQYLNDTWIATDSDNTSVHYIGNEEEIKTFEYNDVFTAMEMRPESGNLLTKNYDENGFLGMTLYNLEGEFISQCENSLKGADFLHDLVWSEGDNGYFFLMMDASGKDKLMFWDISTEIVGKDLSSEVIPTEILAENAVSQELYTKAKAIGYKHGIEIRIADQMDENYIDYKVEKNLDEHQIDAALEILGRELLIYPEGYFSQLLHGSVREIEIHLAGTLTNLEVPKGNVNGFTSYSGFAQTREGKAVVVLDMNEEEELVRFLHHELFHLVDDKLSFDAMIREDAMYSEEEWMKLNPEGFEYAGSTFELPDELYNEEYDVWFIDMYSRTMSREDRARIMEYAMLGDCNMFIAAPYRQAKLEYLNHCIRDAFDTTGWPEKTVWEETLEKSY